jgi:hypothetical protein
MKAPATRFENVVVWWQKARHFVPTAYSQSILNSAT